MSKPTKRVLELAHLMVSEHRNGNPVTLEYMASLLQRRDDKAFGNSTYIKAKAVFDRLITHPILMDDKKMEAVGVAAAFALLNEMPAANSAYEILNVSVDREVANMKRLNVIKKAAENLDVIKSPMAKVEKLLNDNGGANAAGVISDAIKKIDALTTLIYKECETKESENGG